MLGFTILPFDVRGFTYLVALLSPANSSAIYKLEALSFQTSNLQPVNECKIESENQSELLEAFSNT